MKIELRVGLGNTCPYIDTCYSIFHLHFNLYVHYPSFFTQRPESKLNQIVMLLLSSS